MKHLFSLLLLILTLNLFAQEQNFYEKPPVFPDCSEVEVSLLKQCFDTQIFSLVLKNFQVPEDVTKENYKGDVFVLFEVDTKGNFKVVYVDATYKSLKEEVQRVFGEFPKIQPATYNGNAIYKQYSITIKIPLGSQSINSDSLSLEEKQAKEISKLDAAAKTEFDSVNKSLVPFKNEAYSSQLNIPFTHSYYAKFDRSMNLVGTNSHTASKPFMFDEVSSYYDFNAEKEALKKETQTWAGKKLWNEHLVQLQGKDYWFALDPIFDLQVGKDTDADFNSTFNNTRGVYVQGGLGKKFNFFTALYESQGRFAQYYNQYAESIKAADEVAIIPGRGIAKPFKKDAYDYPVAEAYLSYSPAN